MNPFRELAALTAGIALGIPAHMVMGPYAWLALAGVVPFLTYCWGRARSAPVVPAVTERTVIRAVDWR